MLRHLFLCLILCSTVLPSHGQDVGPLRKSVISVLENARSKNVLQATKTRIQSIVKPYISNNGTSVTAPSVDDLGHDIDLATKAMPRDLELELANSIKNDPSILAIISNPNAHQDVTQIPPNRQVFYAPEVMYLNRTTSKRGQESRLTSAKHLEQLKKTLRMVGPIVTDKSGQLFGLQLIDSPSGELFGRFIEIKIGSFGEPDVILTPNTISALVFPVSDTQKIFSEMQKRIVPRKVRDTNFRFGPFTRFGMNISRTDSPLTSLCGVMFCTALDIATIPVQLSAWGISRSMKTAKTVRELEKLNRMSKETGLLVFASEEYQAIRAALIEELNQRYRPGQTKESECAKALEP